MAKQKPQTEGRKKTECPVSEREFMDSAKPVKITVECGDDKAVMVLNPKKFSTGSLGWHANEKAVLNVGATPVKVQCNLGLTLVGSKNNGNGAAEE